uniref:C2H2-type domain-containing protein n=1 Tax=Glossina brevipalpis TaxID=37001 RepID=A0A1A9WDW4_9MUSC
MQKGEELSVLRKCGEIFYDTLTASDVNVTFQCTFCRKTFADLNAFLQHFQNEHYKPPTTVEEFSLEIDKEEEEAEIILFSTEEIIAAEDNTNHTIQYVFDKYDDTTSPLTYILKSTNVETDSDHNSNASTRSKSQLINREHICPHCNKVFKEACDLKKHLNIHNGVKPFKCDHCPASYVYKSNLTTHKRCHESSDSRKGYERERQKGRKACYFCGKIFTSTSNRRRHERIHTGERPFVCEYCGRSFSSSSDLSSHRSSQHLKERNFVCDICDKRFNRRSQLRIHQANVHVDKPPTHICTLCKAAFKKINDLKTHINIHKEKAYKCAECNKSFSHASGLYAHRKIHRKQREESLIDILVEEI